MCHNIGHSEDITEDILGQRKDNNQHSMMSSSEDSDDDVETRRSPDSTVNIRDSSDDEDQPGPGGSRSRSASLVRSSLSRSVSPETSTRKLFIDSDDDGEVDERNTVAQNQNKAQEEARNVPVDDDSDDDIVRRDDDDRVSHGNDFDLMMAQKKEENRRHRRRKDIDVINDNDDAIARLIAEMRIAAKEDRDLNEHGKPAIKKIGMLRHVMHNLTKV